MNTIIPILHFPFFKYNRSILGFITGSIALNAKRRYLSYSEVDFAMKAFEYRNDFDTVG